MFIGKKEYKILLFILIILLILCAFTKSKETFENEKLERDYNYFINQLEENKNKTYRSLLIDDLINKSESQTNIKKQLNKRMNNIDVKIEKIMTPNNVYNGNNPNKYQYIKNTQHYE